MDIDPACASAMQLAGADEFYEFCVRDWTRMVHLLISVEKLLPAAFVTNEEFAEHEFVPGDLIVYKQLFERVRVRFLVYQESDPHRSINENH